MPSTLSQLSEPVHTATTERCPLCNAELTPNHPDECPHCDWVRGYRHRKLIGTKRDRIAAALSIIPGAGHYFKGHKLAAWLFLFGLIPAMGISFMVGLPTIGVGFLLLPAYIACVAWQAYWLEDWKERPAQT